MKPRSAKRRSPDGRSCLIAVHDPLESRCIVDRTRKPIVTILSYWGRNHHGLQRIGAEMGARLEFLAATMGVMLVAQIAHAAETAHNVILFVPDGLRALGVTPQIASTMAAVRDQGVNFANPHSLFPTFTMPNSSGMSTGHMLGDTGTFSNTVYTGYKVKPAADS